MVTINVTTGTSPTDIFAGLPASTTLDIVVDAIWYSHTLVAVRDAAGTAPVVLTTTADVVGVRLNSVRSAPQPRSRS